MARCSSCSCASSARASRRRCAHARRRRPDRCGAVGAASVVRVDHAVRRATRGDAARDVHAARAAGVGAWARTTCELPTSRVAVDGGRVRRVHVARRGQQGEWCVAPGACVGGRFGDPRRSDPTAIATRLRALRTAMLIVPSVLLLGWLLSMLPAMPADSLAAVDRRATPAHRTARAGRLPAVAAVPRVLSTGLYNDAYVASTGLRRPRRRGSRSRSSSA